MRIFPLGFHINIGTYYLHQRWTIGFIFLDQWKDIFKLLTWCNVRLFHCCIFALRNSDSRQKDSKELKRDSAPIIFLSTLSTGCQKTTRVYFKFHCRVEKESKNWWPSISVLCAEMNHSEIYTYRPEMIWRNLILLL